MKFIDTIERLRGIGGMGGGKVLGHFYRNCITVRSCTEEYNGTSWTAGGALITGRYFLGGAGEQNAALGFGGNCVLCV